MRKYFDLRPCFRAAEARASTVLRANGLTKKSRAKPIIGFSDTETVKLDFATILPFVMFGTGL